MMIRLEKEQLIDVMFAALCKRPDASMNIAWVHHCFTLISYKTIIFVNNNNFILQKYIFIKNNILLKIM